LPTWSKLPKVKCGKLWLATKHTTTEHSNTAGDITAEDDRTSSDESSLPVQSSDRI